MTPPRLASLALAALTLTTAAALTTRARADDPRLGRCQDRTDWLPADRAPDGTPPEARRLETWLAQLPPSELDRVLLAPDDIARLNDRNSDTVGAWRDPLADRALDADAIASELMERLNEVGERVASGEYVEDEPGAFAALRPVYAGARAVDEVRAVVRVTDLRCVPLASGLFRGHIDRLFDRNQCSRLHPGEVVRVLRRTADDAWAYVRAGHGVGWLDPTALSPEVPLDAARELRDRRPQLVVLDDWIPAERPDGERFFLRFGTELPIVGADAERWQILAPSERGYEDAFVAKGPGLRWGALPLTRRAFLTLAFARMGDPYGWGGTGSGRDCSGLLLDAMASFDLRLGRHSGVQAQAGWTRVDVAGRSDADKVLAIRAAAAQGIVFLYMPGHIMLYLGELDGRPYALSAISEYLMPCPDGGKRTVRLDRVEVTDLERGRGTERTAFLERIATLSIFGR